MLFGGGGGGDVNRYDGTVGDVRLSGAEALCMLFNPGILLLGPWYSKVVVPSQHPDPSVGSAVALQGGGS
jgi:hypothetical protein